jgi:hypothetical protein
MATCPALLTRLRDMLAHLKADLVQEVPVEIELCESNCTKLQCREAEWETCPRRLSHVASRKLHSR